MVHENVFQSTKADFDRDGFAIVRGFHSTEEARGLTNQVERYVAEVVPKLPAEAVFYENKQRPETMMRLDMMEKYDLYFDELLCGERFTAFASTLLGDTVVPKFVEMFAKVPRIGKPTPPHQDGNYFMLVPNEALTFWLPIDPVDEENGCIRYSRGSHQRGMRNHERSNVFGFSLGITDYGTKEDEANETAVCLQPGDAVIHHSMTIHRTDDNPTDRPRRAIGLVYYARRAQVDESADQRHRATTREQWKAKD
jgi:phytanoyl-CoA hydroxylase